MRLGDFGDLMTLYANGFTQAKMTDVRFARLRRSERLYFESHKAFPGQIWERLEFLPTEQQTALQLGHAPFRRRPEPWKTVIDRSIQQGWMVCMVLPSGCPPRRERPRVNKIKELLFLQYPKWPSLDHGKSVRAPWSDRAKNFVFEH